MGKPTDELDMEKLGALYEFQKDLPTLPVPDYKESAQIYLKSTKPLCKDEGEYQKIEKQVADFSAPGGIGEKLQERLEARNKVES